MPRLLQKVMEPWQLLSKWSTVTCRIQHKKVFVVIADDEMGEEELKVLIIMLIALMVGFVAQNACM